MTSEAGGREERDRWGEGENETNHQRKIGDAKAASSTVPVPVTAPHSRPAGGAGRRRRRRSWREEGKRGDRHQPPSADAPGSWGATDRLAETRDLLTLPREGEKT